MKKQLKNIILFALVAVFVLVGFIPFAKLTAKKDEGYTVIDNRTFAQKLTDFRNKPDENLFYHHALVDLNSFIARLSGSD